MCAFLTLLLSESEGAQHRRERRRAEEDGDDGDTQTMGEHGDICSGGRRKGSAFFWRPDVQAVARVYIYMYTYAFNSFVRERERETGCCFRLTLLLRGMQSARARVHAMRVIKGRLLFFRWLLFFGRKERGTFEAYVRDV